MAKSCELCAAPFQGHRDTQRFCSVRCSNASRPRPNRTATCKGCGSGFVSRNRGADRGWTRYCSNICRAKNEGYKGGPAASRRRRRYGLEPEDYAALLSAQNGACALCCETPDYDLYVDHDHSTGRVRALLCARCNTAAGVFDRSSWQDVLELWAYCHTESGNTP